MNAPTAPDLLTLSMGLLSALGLGGCTSTVPPQEAFGRLEARLLAAETLQIAFAITAEGAIEANVSGRLAIDRDGAIELAAEGSFAGDTVVLELTTQGERYTYGNATERTMALRPSALEEALLIGLMRMGILHNLALLAEGAPPDHADGGVREWVTTSDFAREDGAIAFSITVAGNTVASATLTLDADGRPLERRQSVRFPEGEMRVVERYASVVIEP